jgi:acetyl esterase/lipase
MMRATLLSLLMLSMPFLAAIANAQGNEQPRPIPLWPEGAPGNQGTAPEDIPSIQLYQPTTDKASGAAIVVCPGGGYRNLAPHEGHDIGVWFKNLGVTAVVLKYRLGPRYQHPAMMQDVQRAIRYSRFKATEWGIDPNRVGVMGFSAGGHLASTAATHFELANPEIKDPIDRLSSRPDVAILCYPVITMTDPFAHKGSRQNLLGANPSQEMINLMSNEKMVTDKTPPTFLFHTEDDAGVPVENSLLFAAALRKAKVPHEIHVFEHGRHGVGLAPTDPVLSEWPKLLENWLRTRKFITMAQRTAEATPNRPRPPSLLALIDELRNAPPELAARGMIGIADHPDTDGAWKAELLEEAFEFSEKAQHPMTRRYLHPMTETHEAYLAKAFRLGLDRMTLRAMIIDRLSLIDVEKARRLLDRCPDVSVPPVPCEEVLAHDPGIHYEMLVNLSTRGFTPDEFRGGEHLRQIEPLIRKMHSPAQIDPIAKMIRSLRTTEVQMSDLVQTFARTMSQVNGDDRAFHGLAAMNANAYTEIADLVSACRGRDLSRAELVFAFRFFLVRHLEGGRCTDNLYIDRRAYLTPPYLSTFHRAMSSAELTPEPINLERLSPRSLQPTAIVHPYWMTPKAAKILRDMLWLRSGDGNSRIESGERAPATRAGTDIRKTDAWQYALKALMDEIELWKPSHEASETDYFNQKCYVYNFLIEMCPANSIRGRIIDEYLSFLELERPRRNHFILWYRPIAELLRQIKGQEKESREQLFEAMKASGDPLLPLLIKMIPYLSSNQTLTIR